MILLKDIISEQRLSEVPVDTYKTIGDFDKPKSFADKRDRELIKNPLTVEKVKDFFKNTDFTFDLYFVNLSGRRKFSEMGNVSEKFIFDKYPDGLGILPKQLNNGKINKDNITIFYVGNTAAEKTPMTAWTMAHRFGHVIRTQRSGKTNYAWKVMVDDWLDKEFDKLLALYNVNVTSNRYDPNYYDISASFIKSKAYLFNQIGTMRSARLGKIKRPYEFYYELFAQYLKNGYIKLNSLEHIIKTGSAPYGRSKMASTKNIDEVNDILKSIENDFRFYAEDVLSECVGNIYVM
jgi:hypothetical protein